MTTNNTTATITLEDAVKAVAGEHFPAIMEEYCDLNNDLRVSTTRELMDLGLPRLVADKCLFIVREAYVGKPVETALADA